jgi:hypothetical protein
VAVKLEKDRGYIDLPTKGAKPAKTEEVVEA